MRERALRIVYFHFSGKYDYHKYNLTASRPTYYSVGVIEVSLASNCLRQTLTFIATVKCRAKVYSLFEILRCMFNTTFPSLSSL